MNDQIEYGIDYVIKNIHQFNKDELLSFDFCKILDTPRYKNHDIVVFRNGMFYNYVTRNFISKRRKSGKTYTTIYTRNQSGTYTTMIVPYIVCCLFKKDYLKHGKNEQNNFTYIDGNCDNCDSSNILANYYNYKIIEYVDDDKAYVDICGYNVLLNIDFINNELNKYVFHVIPNGNLIYFSSSSNGKNMRLHQIVMNYYHPGELITGAIDYQNHNTLDNTIENLNHINFRINSANNLNIHPVWQENKQTWLVRSTIDGVRSQKSFSVYNYGNKDIAYQNAIKYINDVLIPEKISFISKKDLELKIKEFDNLIKFFLDNNMKNKLIELLNNNNIIVDAENFMKSNK